MLLAAFRIQVLERQDFELTENVTDAGRRQIRPLRGHRPAADTVSPRSLADPGATRFRLSSGGGG